MPFRFLGNIFGRPSRRQTAIDNDSVSPPSASPPPASPPLASPPSASPLPRPSSNTPVDATSTSRPLEAPPSYYDMSGVVNHVPQPIAESEPFQRRVVQLCPHETLSFERLQLILGLPNFKQSFRGIDALGATVVAHHSRPPLPDSFRTCEASNVDDDCKVFGEVRLNYVHKASHSDPRFRHYGLEMRSSWRFLFHGAIRASQTKLSLQQYLRTVELSICPHQSVSDVWILDTLCRIMHLVEVSEDPVDEWLAKTNGKNNKPYKHECPHCATVCEISGTEQYPIINVKRFFGRGRYAVDSVWVEQCVGRDA